MLSGQDQSIADGFARASRERIGWNKEKTMVRTRVPLLASMVRASEWHDRAGLRA
jgi:hypothetical protein